MPLHYCQFADDAQGSEIMQGQTWPLNDAACVILRF